MEYRFSHGNAVAIISFEEVTKLFHVTTTVQSIIVCLV